MSDYKNNTSTVKLKDTEYKWDEIWDSLYYNFINTHYKSLKKNYFMSRNTMHWDNKSNEDKKKILELSKKYIQFLTS